VAAAAAVMKCGRSVTDSRQTVTSSAERTAGGQQVIDRPAEVTSQ